MQDEFQQIENKDQSFNLKQFLYEKVIAYWIIYVAFLVIALVTARYYLWYSTPVYTSTTSLMLGMDDKKFGEQDLLAKLASMDNNGSIESQMQIIKSRNIITRTIEQLDFKFTYWLEGDIKTSELYKNSAIELVTDSSTSTESIPEIIVKVVSPEDFEITYKNIHSNVVEVKKGRFNETIKTDFGNIQFILRDPNRLKIYKNSINEKNIYRITPNTTENLVNSYSQRMSVTQIKGTRLVLVSVDDPVPQKGCDFLNKLTEVYLAYGVEQKNEDTQNSLRFIDQQLSVITNELLNSEGKLEKYKTENGIIDLTGTASISQGEATRIEGDLNNINLQQTFLKYLDDYIRKGNNVKYLAPAYVSVTEDFLQILLTNLRALQTERENALKYTTEDNPLIQKKNIQIENTKAEILEKIKSLRDVSNISKLQTLDQLNKVNAKIRELPREEKELSSIIRQATITE